MYAMKLMVYYDYTSPVKIICRIPVHPRDRKLGTHLDPSPSDQPTLTTNGWHNNATRPVKT